MRCDPEISIAWSVNAKNSLSNTYGSSPHQLVFGTNPRVPGIMKENITPGTLNHEGVLKIVSDHLNALSLARQKFVELEASDKLKRALQQRIFPQANYRYCSGDLVYFKRSKKFWYGPATVFDLYLLIKYKSNTVVTSLECTRVRWFSNREQKIKLKEVVQPHRGVPVSLL